MNMKFNPPEKFAERNFAPSHDAIAPGNKFVHAQILMSCKSVHFLVV